MKLTEMDAFNLPYSGKDIPAPTMAEYSRIFLLQLLCFLTRCRWKVFHFKNPNNARRKETYGFNTTCPAPPDPDLKRFEELMFEMLNKIKSRPIHNKYQRDLKEKVQEIDDCPDVIVSADKTANYYRIPPDQYNKLLTDSVTKDYQKIEQDIEDKINREAAEIAKKLDIEDRVDIYIYLFIY